MDEEHKITFGTLNPSGELSNVRLLPQSAIGKCPHFIFMPEHYRKDNTCRCDDKEHKEMGEWGYKWNDKKGRWS